MSLFGALSASLTALTAQSAAVNIISNNIANLGTAGFKSSSTSFSTLIAGSVGGGVLQGVRNDIDRQGAISSTAVGTDLAVQGNGFFTVSDVAGNTLFTRSGSFRSDKDGNLVNEAGYRLMGWPLDSQGRIPGESGNSQYTTSSQDIKSLRNISSTDVTGIASPTSVITAKINLRAEETILEGAGSTIDFASTANTTNSSSTIIVPKGFANGDTFTVTVTNDGTATPYEFIYGGIALSNDIADGIGGATSATGSFTSFTNGNSFSIQTDSMPEPVTFTYNSTSNTNLNEFKNLRELSLIINSTDGLRSRIDNGIMYISAANANDGIDFANVSGTLLTSFGLADVAADPDGVRFATLGNLADVINGLNNDDIAATLNNPTGNATLKIYNVDPTGTIQFSDAIATVGGYGDVTFTGAANSSNTSTSLIVPPGSGTDSLTVALSGGGSFTYTLGGYAESDDISGGIGGSTSASVAFTTFSDGDAFTIQSSSMGSAVTFTFDSTPTSSQFSTLEELADLIDGTTGLRARLEDGVLYVVADDANDGLTFADVAASGLTAEFGFSNVTSGTNRFASLEELEDLVDGSTGLSATITNPTGTPTLTISNTDLTETMTFTDGAAAFEIDETAAVADSGQMLTEFGLPSTAIDEIYDATGDGGSNMASGAIAPDFSRTITIYDSLGKSVDLRLSFAKIKDTDSDQIWAVELFSINPDAITDAVSQAKNDGLITYGTVSFNGDGTLKSISGPIADEFTINPAGGSSEKSLSISLGTPGDIGLGLADGLSQFAGAYSSDVSQNGFPTGRLQSLQIDSQGFVTAIFDNSLTSKVYKLPLTYFSNPNALSAGSGNAYSANNSSGEPRFGQVGDPSVGTIVPGAVESSTSEIGQQLTNLIVSQQAYSASTNVLRKVSDLFDELKNL
ncbi:MAG TPA: hypothetical protein DIV86_01905 [Alphaproteobacteria bacterium]|nr:hypothetical protein [Alphaproteobacteria bacterium]